MQERLQRFVHDRMQMTAAISHDLRTPITRLRLRAEFVEDEEQRRKLLRDLDDMEAMVDATLAFTREEASTEAMASVDLVSLAETVCEDRAEVTLELGAGIEPRLLCFCRPVAMRRCLANPRQCGQVRQQRARSPGTGVGFRDHSHRRRWPRCSGGGPGEGVRAFRET